MALQDRFASLFALVGNQRNGSAARRAAFICWMAIPAYLLVGCAFFAGWLLAGGAGLDVAAITAWAALYALVATLGWALLGVTGLWLDAGRRRDGAYVQVVLWWYAANAVTLCYLIGTQHIVTGLVMMGAPLVGLMLFPMRQVLSVFAAALGGVLALDLAATWGHVTYGPVLAAGAAADPSLALYWSLAGVVGAGAYVVYDALIMMALISGWHTREAGVRELSRIDPLTLTANRRHILDELERQLAQLRRDDDWLALLMIDIDHFKQINDRFGHLAGDRALAAAADALRRCLRGNDMIGRYGGEEFLVVLPGSTIESAREIAERCRHAVSNVGFDVNGSRLTLTASLGVAARRAGSVTDADQLIHIADEAMYFAKQRGRNRVTVA